MLRDHIVWDGISSNAGAASCSPPPPPKRHLERKIVKGREDSDFPSHLCHKVAPQCMNGGPNPPHDLIIISLHVFLPLQAYLCKQLDFHHKFTCTVTPLFRRESAIGQGFPASRLFPRCVDELLNPFGC